MNLPRTGAILLKSATLAFNADPQILLLVHNFCGQTLLEHWFGGSAGCDLYEEVIGLGSYSFTLSVFSSDNLPDDPVDDEDEETALIECYTPRFARGR